MSTGFEVYKRQRSTPSNDPFITIRKKGLLSLNRAAYEALGAPSAVELLYNRADRLIAIRKAKPGVAHAYELRPVVGSSQSWTLSGKGFLSFYGIEVQDAVRRSARMGDGMLVIDLKDPGVAASPGRQKR